jgi:hypothetical protein
VVLILRYGYPASGSIVFPWGFLFPLGCIVAGIWVLTAASWIDRHRAWDRISTPEEREAYADTRSVFRRSLPLGLLLSALGGAAGMALVWLKETDLGIPGGFALGALGGFVFGLSLAGFREGVRSGVGKTADGKSQDPEQGDAAHEPRQ